MWSGSDRESDRAVVTVCMKIKQFTHWLDAFVLFDNGLTTHGTRLVIITKIAINKTMSDISRKNNFLGWNVL